ncbi:hypothetical protein ACFRFC_08460, partial [Streptomyces sp. NPDC056734]|uniref:hypothetical protein n=1 Tax=Streptomyces sp. NPDC056734 TaxID=3345931 RepID=UPI0036A406FB
TPQGAAAHPASRRRTPEERTPDTPGAVRDTRGRMRRPPGERTRIAPGTGHDTRERLRHLR